MDQQLRKRTDDLPYLYKYFNIIPLFTASNGSADGSLYRSYNAVVEGFNQNVRMPRYVIMILDCDIIIHTDFFSYGVKPIFEAEMQWLMRNLDRAISTRREELKEKCAGAVGHDAKVIWIAMIPRPYIKGHPIRFFNNTVNLRLKFNDVVKENLVGRKNHFWMEHHRDHFHDYQDYDHLGRLSHVGKIHYWRFVNTQLRKFEKGEISLLPAKK